MGKPAPSTGRAFLHPITNKAFTMHKYQPSSIPRGREENTVQVRVRRKRIVDGHSQGVVFWTTPTRAKLFKDQQAVDIIGDDGQVIEDTVEAGGANEGKSLSAPSTSPSTDSASSSPSGPSTPSSASGADQASQSNNANASDAQENKTGAGSSQSTTATSGAPGQTSSTSRTTGGGNGTGTNRNSRGSRG